MRTSWNTCRRRRGPTTRPRAPPPRASGWSARDDNLRPRYRHLWTATRETHTVVEGTVELAERWIDHPALAPCAGIIHLAALVRHSRSDAKAVFRTNVDGTQQIVRADARLGCRVVFVSTSGTVGCSLDPFAAPDEEAPFAGRTVARWPYFAAKVAAATVRALMHRHPRATYHLLGWNGTLYGFAGLVARVAGRRTRPTVVPWRIARLGAAALAPFGHFVDPVMVEMARHHWNIRSRYSAAELDYRSRDPEVTLRDCLAA